MDLFKDVINGVMNGNKKLFQDPEAVRVYNAFMVNRALSYHQDTLYYANDLNQLHLLDKKPQVDFYLNTVRAKKRSFVKWAKSIQEKDLQSVKMYFGYSDRQASDALRVLTEDQLTFIREKTKIGE